jgi:hypothetical protein
MPTIRERIRRGFQQQAERLGAALAALLGPMAVHNFVPRGVADIAVHRLDRRLSSCLAVCGPLLGWPVSLAPKRVGSRELFQNDFLSARQVNRGVIICQMNEYGRDKTSQNAFLHEQIGDP